MKDDYFTEHICIALVEFKGKYLEIKL